MTENELKNQPPKTRRKRRTHTAAFKAKVAFEALKGEKTLAELAEQYDLYINQVHHWRKHLQDNLVRVFEVKGNGHNDQASQILALQAKVGQLTMEKDALSKSLES